MRILVLHSRYATGSSSGENRVVEDEVELLRTVGHDVAAWTPSPPTSRSGKALLGPRAVWSTKARRHVARLVRSHRPDVIHAHNLFPLLSPAVLRTRSTPVVVTLHNYRLLCLPAVFLRDGATCEDCLGRLPWRGVVHRCYRSSAAGSAALATSLTAHRWAGTFDHVSRFLAVSEFVRQKHLRAGFRSEQIEVKPNFVPSTGHREGPGGDFMYVGRLSVEKGLSQLLPLWADVPARLTVVGDGPERAALESAAPENVRFIGSVPPEEVPKLLRSARALVLPSICYEGAPRTIVEAFAAGVPVLGSRLGAIPTVVDEHENGLLATPGRREDWVSAAARLLDDAESIRMGASARAAWQQRYSPESAASRLEAVYNRVIQEDGTRETGNLRNHVGELVD